MDIWAQMRLDKEGRAENVHFPDAEGYSPELLSALGLRMALARFEPFEKEGRPIAVDTPAMVMIAIDGAGGQVRSGSNRSNWCRA